LEPGIPTLKTSTGHCSDPADHASNTLCATGLVTVELIDISNSFAPANSTAQVERFLGARDFDAVDRPSHSTTLHQSFILFLTCLTHNAFS